jgi:Holliday junction resolvase
MPKGQLGSHKTQKEKSTDSENQWAKELGGKRVTGSGCTDGAKGDIKSDDFLIELKETTNKSILVDQTIISKICREAREAGKKPALAIQFSKTPLGVPRKWVAIPLELFKELTNDN